MSEDEPLRGTGQTTARMLRAMAAVLERPDEWVTFRDHFPSRDAVRVRAYATLLSDLVRRMCLTMDVEARRGWVRLRSPITRLRRERAEQWGLTRR